MPVQASPVTFELYSLGWKAFQDLCSTVLSEVLGQTFQTFLPTNDEGRDGSFQGRWSPVQGEAFEGAFTVQCKFTAKRDKNLTLSDVRNELEKARDLGSRGMAETYLLITNAGISAEAESQMRTAFLALPGVRHFAAYHGDWLNQKICESQRLRMLVPCVYGLGDLSQILDQRAYRQAQEILHVFGDELAKFVITDAHQRSVRALSNCGFVLLLGEAAAGKSTVALALALAAADQWSRSPVRIRDADDFERYWNPEEPQQFFWVDDAFGDRQFQPELASKWNRTFQHLRAAVKKGAWVVFTSRDYIFRAARSHLKESAFPLLHDSSVVIDVQRLSPQEKEQILYNHLRLGTQPLEFRRAIKPFLLSIARNASFLPETARRLADPFFTRELSLTEFSLRTFVEKPVPFLVEVIMHLDKQSRAALALLFMRGGTAATPIDLSREEEEAFRLLGADLGGVVEALRALNQSLVVDRIERGEAAWRFKHPTVRDAFGALIAGDSNLLDIYLHGTPVEKLITEVVCGDIYLEGAKVLVPSSRFELMLKKLDQRKWSDGIEYWKLTPFFRWRCSDAFLRFWAEMRPHQVEAYCERPTWAAWIMARLHRMGILSGELRRHYVQCATRDAIDVPDADFLDPELRGLFTPEEWQYVRSRVIGELCPNLSAIIEDHDSRFDYLGDEDPGDYFDALRTALSAYEDEFMNAQVDEKGFLTEWPISRAFADACADIDEMVKTWIGRRARHEAEQRFVEKEWGAPFEDHPPTASSSESEQAKPNVVLPVVMRSIFDDVDL